MRNMAIQPSVPAKSIINGGLLLGPTCILELAHSLCLVPSALIVDHVGAGAHHADHCDASAQDESSVLDAGV